MQHPSANISTAARESADKKQRQDIQSEDLGRISGLDVEALGLARVASDDAEVLAGDCEDGAAVVAVGVELVLLGLLVVVVVVGRGGGGVVVGVGGGHHGHWEREAWHCGIVDGWMVVVDSDKYTEYKTKTQ